MRRASLVLLLLCGCAASIPNRGKLMMRDVSYPLRDMRYPSGLRIIVEEDKREPVVGVVVLAGTGASADPLGKEGLAHLAEHLMFRGVAAGPPAWTALHRTGAVGINAFTQSDITAYFEAAPKDALGDLLRIEAERFYSPLRRVDQATFLVEREVVRNEIRQRGETGYSGQAFDWLRESLFPASHPYARSIGGSHQSLSAITLEDVTAFVEKHYRPENLTVVITGDVDLRSIDALVARTFPAKLLGGVPSMRPVQPRLPALAPEPPVAPGPKLVKKQGAVPTPELWVAWTLPRSFDADSHLIGFAQNKAAGALVQAFMADEDIAGVGVFVIPGVEASILVCYVPLNEGRDPDRSYTAVVDQIYKAWFSEEADLHGQVSFSKARFSAITSMTAQAEGLLNRAVNRAQFTHFSGDATLYSRSLRAVAELKSTQVGAFAEKYLNRDRARAVYIAPLPADAVPPEGAAGLGAELPGDEQVVFPVTALPARLQTLRPAPPHRFTLPSGMEVLIDRRPGMPIATVGLALRGGEVGGQPLGVSRMAEWVISAGSRLNGEARDFGASSYHEGGADDFRYVMRGAAGNLPNMLAILSERVPSMKSPEWLPRMHAVVMPQRLKADQLPELRAERAFLNAVYGDHPAGRSASVADMMKVGAWDIAEWIRQTHVPANAVLAISGEVEVAQTEALVRQWFGGWVTPGVAVSAPPAPTSAPSQRLLVTHRPGATQGQLSLGCRLPASAAGVAPEHLLMTQLAAEELRVMLREQLGATYGAQHQLDLGRGGAILARWSTTVENAKLEQAIKTVRATFEKLAAEVDPVALDRVRWVAAHQQALSRGTSWASVDALLNARMLDLDPEQSPNVAEAMVNVSGPQVRAAFGACLKNGLVLSVVGDEATVQKAVTAAGWEP
ncbi:MAG: insulinase family protein [Myxococcota bacterium]|nr:insulinase family protein [Myxococcota bacterium]